MRHAITDVHTVVAEARLLQEQRIRKEQKWENDLQEEERAFSQMSELELRVAQRKNRVYIYAREANMIALRKYLAAGGDVDAVRSKHQGDSINGCFKNGTYRFLSDAINMDYIISRLQPFGCFYS